MPTRSALHGLPSSVEDLTAEVARLREELAAAERKLQAGESRYSLILNSAVDYAIMALDLDGLVTEWNEGAHRILGWSEAEMLGRPAAVFFTDEDRQAGVPQREMSLTLENGRGNDERWHLRKDGTLFFATGEMMPLRNEAGAIDGFIKLVRDRTEQRLAEEQRKADAEFLRSVLASSGDCIKVLDLDGRLHFMSEGGMRVMEVSDFNAIRGCPWLGLWKGAGHALAEAALDAARRGGTGRFQGYADTMAGHARWWDVQVTPILDAQGRPERILSVSRDLTATKLAEQALQQSEQRYRALYNAIDMGFCIIEVQCDDDARPVGGRFLEVNEAFKRHTGLDDAIGRGLRDLALGHTEEWADRYAELVGAGGSIRFEWSHAGRHYEVYAYRIGGTDEHQVAILFSDVSARKRDGARRAALFELGDRLAEQEREADLPDVACAILGQTLGVQQVGYGLVDAEAETITVDRNWTEAGARSLVGTLSFRSFGSYIEDLKRGETVVVTDARTDPRTRDFAAALEARGARAFVNTPVFEGGHFRALQYVSTVVPRDWSEDELLFVQEVAARTRAAIERRRAERDLSDLAASLERQVQLRTRELDRAWRLSQELLVVALPDGMITAVNPIWTQLLGWQAHELIGSNLVAYTHPDDLEGTLATFSGMLGAPLVSSQEHRLRHKDGSYRWFGWTGAFEDGKIYASGRDLMVERQQAEALRQSQKMEAVGQLTGGVAHDFNNLLTIIRSSVDFLRRPGLPEERRHRYVEAVSDTVDRAAKLTGQLLAFARQQALKPEVFDAGAKLRGVGDMLDTVTGSRVAVAIEVPDEPCLVRADVSQFETALINMAVNARDAMDGQGRLTLRLSASVPLPRIRGHAGSNDRFAAVLVTDTGSGIPEDQLARIFEPFFTTKEVGRGTGLGLSQVFGFAKQSGGDVDVESAVGEGSTFTLYLPQEHGAVAAGVAPASADAGPGGTGQCILVVEDNVEVGQFCTQILRDLGYRTTLANTAEEALAALGPAGEGFDAVFSDVVMPGIGGVALAEVLRERLPWLPVVLTSGYSHVLARDTAHGFELLHKPYSAEQVGRVLQRIIARAEAASASD